MESIHIRQVLRPLRYAFIVKDGDLAAALTAVSINSALWGGIYNPIIQLTDAAGAQDLLGSFDPDLLVNLTGHPLSGSMIQDFQHRIVESADIVQVDNRGTRRGLGLGFNIIPVLEAFRRAETQSFPPIARTALLSASAAEGLPEYAAFVHGSYQWLPPMGVQIEDIYRRGLRAQAVSLPKLQATPEYGSLLFPIDFTRHGLRTSDSPRWLSDHVIFVGHHRSVADLIAFWNVRATGREVVFVSADALEEFEGSVRTVLATCGYEPGQQRGSRALLQTGPDVSTQTFQTVRAWIKSLAFDQYMIVGSAPSAGFVMEWTPAGVTAPTLEAAASEDIALLANGRVTPVKMIQPPYIEREDQQGSAFRWAVDVITFFGARNTEFMFTLPREPEVEAILTRNALRIPGEVRLGKRGITYVEGWMRSHLSINPVLTKDVFSALFQQAGFRSEPSQPGQYAEQIIAKMGSLHGGCRVLKIRGVREIIERLGGGDSLTQGNMRDIVTRTKPDTNGTNWRSELYDDLVLRHGQRAPLEFGTVFDVLLEKRIIRPGYSFKCSTCFKEDWYHVSEFTEEYTCRYCFTAQRVNFASKKEWLYKADGLFRIPESAQGSVGVILSIWRWAELSSFDETSYVTSQILVDIKTGKRSEIDYAVVVTGIGDQSYELVLGESARFGDFTDEEVAVIADIAGHFPRRPFIAFTTLKDAYSNAEKSRLRALAAEGHKIIALTREELDPYSLFKRCEHAPHRFPSSLNDLSENTMHLNVGTD